jgi:hypothetical protein
MEDVGEFYVHSVYFTAICHILWPFGIFSGYLVYFFWFWSAVARKIWQPWSTVHCGGQLDLDFFTLNLHLLLTSPQTQ